MSPQRQNLDWLAAHHAQKVIGRTGNDEAGEVDNTVTKTLGILQENGIYASALYLKSRPKSEQDRAGVVLDEMLSLLDALGFGWGNPRSQDAAQILRHLSERVISDRLERLLLAKETLERMLVYARYGAKARGAGD